MKLVRKDSLETRQRLVDAAERLFAEQGVEHVKLVDVSRAAGQKNRNAAQYHYGDKAGLINAVLDKHSDVIAEQRRHSLAFLEQKKSVTMRELVELVVLPVANHVRSDPNGVTYLRVNRQLANTSERRHLILQRTNSMPEVLRLQHMIKDRMKPHSKSAMQAKMILIHCMLFNGLANFYDLHPNAGSKAFVDTLCASITAVLLEGA